MIKRIMKKADFAKKVNTNKSAYDELEAMRREAMSVIVDRVIGKMDYDEYFKTERELTRKNYERCLAASAAFVPRNLRNL